MEYSRSFRVKPGKKVDLDNLGADFKPDNLDRKEVEQQFGSLTEKLRDLQHLMYAEDQRSLLIVLQGRDAAGKDGTIRAVMTGINPAGCQVFSFKQPSAEELDHDFLWRVQRRLPERGRIGIFNRSHYEETLVVRVHPEYLDRQKLPRPIDHDRIWDERFASICAMEEHLARSGTLILKFWLNVSRDEQRRRFLDRIDEPESNWKFSAGDVDERQHWHDYMHAYEEALRTTSRPCAPWYAVPADDKSFMRRTVAEIVAASMEHLDIDYPEVSDERRARMQELRGLLDDEVS